MTTNCLPIESHRGLGSGIYATNNEEACKYIINNSSCNIVVVENAAQMKKIQNIRADCPTVKAVVQYIGDVEASGDNLYTVSFVFFLEN